MNALVTGAAGFIGFHLCLKLIEEGYQVFGIDNINEYYDTKLKFARLNQLGIDTKAQEWKVTVNSTMYNFFKFKRLNLEDLEDLNLLFIEEKFDIVVNLAAQAGVRYSLENPHTYINSNIVGFLNILECCRHHKIKHLVYASSSSVYGNNETMPLSVSENVDHPISLYAATKKSNELMAHTYSHLFDIPTTGLRFFTVYGPWARPDMALFLFTKAIYEGKPIKVFNNGNMVRDFTYIDDIVEGVIKVIEMPSIKANTTGNINVPYRVFNIGNSTPVPLIDFIKEIERQTGREAIKEYLPIQPGDVKITQADTSDLQRLFNYKPSTDISYGIHQFVEWYKNFYKC